MASWIDRIKTQFTMTLGDGSVYTPLSFNANRSTEYNIADFTFRNLDGSLIDKRRPMGTVYNLDLFFQGADNIDLATAFKKSADNSKPWVIQHPFYGSITVQPISPIYHDNGNTILNATRITVTVKETLTKAALIPTESADDVITSMQQACTGGYASYYVNAVPTPSVSTVNLMNSNVSAFKNFMSQSAALEAQVSNSINAAFTAAAGAIGDVQTAISSIQNMVNAILNLPASISVRMGYLIGVIQGMTAADISSINGIRNEIEILAQKVFAFTAIGSAIATMCANTITNVIGSDYTYSSQVAAVIAQVVTTYNSYLALLDSLQDYSGSGPDSFIPDFETLFALDSLVSYTLNNLYTIQANSKQPRVVTLTADNNVIGIAWKIYGLLPDDSTVNQIIQDNNIVGPELLQVPKGRQILYYA